MTREEKINTLLAFLAPLLFEGKNEEDSAPQITILSATEVHVNEFPGVQLAVHKEFVDNPLQDALREIVDQNIAEEQKHWEGCVHEQHEDEDIEDINGNIVYDQELVADHIYHSLRFCSELIEGVELK